MRAATAIVLLTSIAAALLSACGEGQSPPASAQPQATPAPMPTDGRLPLAAPAPLPAPAEVAGRRCRIRGTALVDGAPVTAHVELRQLGDDDWKRRDEDPSARAAPPLATAEALADGAFEFSGLATGEYLLIARHEPTHVAELLVWVGTADAVRRADLVLVADTSRETLRGRVIDVDGTPFRGWVGAKLAPAARRRAGRDVAWVPASADGRFELTQLPLATIELRVSRGRGSNLPGPVLDTARVRETEVRLADALRSIDVRCVTAAGAPVADARVHLGWGKFQDESSDAATTDAVGAARIAVPRDTDEIVRADALGYLPSEAPVRPSDARVIVTLEPALRARVRVVDAATGAPATGALVCPTTSVGSRYPDDLGGKPAGFDGLVEFDDLPPTAEAFRVMGGGWYSADIVAASRPDAASEDRAVVPFTHVAPPGSVTEIRAVRAGSIRGRVVSADGQPASGATVRSRSVEGPWNRSGNGPAVATDTDGRFTVTDLVPGERVALTAESDEFAGEPSVNAAASADAPPDVELRFSPGGWVTAEVQDAETGVTMGGARVSCRVPAERNSWFVQFCDRRSALTGADGRARVGPLLPGTYEVTASRRGYAQGPKLRVTEADFAEGAQRTIVIRLPRGASITGRVLAADGSPARGYTVYVRGRELDEDSFLGDSGDDVGPDGSFEVPDMEPGQYTLDVGQFMTRGLASAVAIAGGPPVDIRLPAPREERPFVREDPPPKPAPQGPPAPPKFDASKEFLVRVESPDGEPVGSATVIAWHGEQFDDSSGVSNGFTVLRLSAAGGRAIVVADSAETGLPPGAGETIVDLPSAPTASFIIRLAVERIVRGRVLDELNRPVTGVIVSAIPALDARFYYDNVTSGPSGEHGEFELRGLGAYAYRLRAVVPDGVVFPPPTPLDETAAEVTIRVSHGEGLLVRVLDADGRPLAGATVQFQCNSRHDVDPRTTDGSGSVRLPCLPADEACWLDVTPPKERDDLLRFTDNAWMPTADRIVRLRKAFRVGGIVVDWTGAPVAGVAVYASKAPDDDERGAPWASKSTDEGGAFLFDRFPEGPVRLAAGDFANHPSGGMDGWVSWSIDEPDALLRASAEVAAGATSARLALPRATCLEVRVTGWSQGRDLPEPPRLATSDGKHTHPALSRGDKPLLFSGLEKDREYALAVRIEDRNLAGYAAGLKAGGAAELKLAPGLVLEGTLQLPAVALDIRSVDLRIAGVELSAHVGADGKFRFDCLPAAPCEIDAFARILDGPMWRGHATAEPGKPVTIEMTEWDGR